MLNRRQAVWLAPAAVLLAGGGAAAWIGMRRPERGAIGGPFALQDGAGREVTDRSFRGKWMLVYFGYTHCPDACPTALQDMANAVDLLGACTAPTFDRSGPAPRRTGSRWCSSASTPSATPRPWCGTT